MNAFIALLLILAITFVNAQETVVSGGDDSDHYNHQFAFGSQLGVGVAAISALLATLI